MLTVIVEYKYWSGEQLSVPVLKYICITHSTMPCDLPLRFANTVTSSECKVGTSSSTSWNGHCVKHGCLIGMNRGSSASCHGCKIRAAREMNVHLAVTTGGIGIPNNHGLLILGHLCHHTSLGRFKTFERGHNLTVCRGAAAEELCHLVVSVISSISCSTHSQLRTRTYYNVKGTVTGRHLCEEGHGGAKEECS